MTRRRFETKKGRVTFGVLSLSSNHFLTSSTYKNRSERILHEVHSYSWVKIGKRLKQYVITMMYSDRACRLTGAMPPKPPLPDILIQEIKATKGQRIT
jgi:hypothetical protein